MMWTVEKNVIAQKTFSDGQAGRIVGRLEEWLDGFRNSWRVGEWFDGFRNSWRNVLRLTERFYCIRLSGYMGGGIVICVWQNDCPMDMGWSNGGWWRKRWVVERNGYSCAEWLDGRDCREAPYSMAWWTLVLSTRDSSAGDIFPYSGTTASFIIQGNHNIFYHKG